jgi:DSHCT (NUC185) domain
MFAQRCKYACFMYNSHCKVLHCCTIWTRRARHACPHCTRLIRVWHCSCMHLCVVRLLLAQQICQITLVQEGTIVRTITRLDELMREVRNSARVVGDPSLYRKMEATSLLIKRGVIFCGRLVSDFPMRHHITPYGINANVIDNVVRGHLVIALMLCDALVKCYQSNPHKL